MEKEILIVKNISREGGGLLEEELKVRNIRYLIVDLNQGEKFPPVENYGAVVVLGGPDSANDENKKMKNQLTRINQTLVAKIPYFGICLGLQTLIKAAGGQVVKNPIKEVGFIDPEDNFFTVEVTDDMKLLATGKFCRNQIVKVGFNAYGIQCHFELTPEMFEVWINEDPDLRQLDKGQLCNSFDEIQDEYTSVERQLYT